MKEDYIPTVDIRDYHYDLPDDRIAVRPPVMRGDSRLLVADTRKESIIHSDFLSLERFLPAQSLLTINTTRVVNARLDFYRTSGGRVEVFLVQPMSPSTDPAAVLGSRQASVWRVLVGGARKARRESRLHMIVPTSEEDVRLSVELRDDGEDGWVGSFSWSSAAVTFAELIHRAGKVPLPPYIHRSPDRRDAVDYQTVYAADEGAVAAPTAGLHFTDRHMETLTNAGHTVMRTALHVGAGTFSPVKGAVSDHRMHREWISVSMDSVNDLATALRRRETGAGGYVIPVGTTSLRTLETLYWYGVRLLTEGAGESTGGTILNQWDAYRLASNHALPTAVESIIAVSDRLVKSGRPDVSGWTELFVLPGYTFRVCDALITNFHQPGSTLILLVAAMMGGTLWRRVYDEALSANYRFLSYGDASLILAPRT